MAAAEIVVGIDPGTAASGVAVYSDGQLVDLQMMTLAELGHYIATHDVFYAIEDVSAHKPVYARNNKGSRAMVNRIAQNVGQVKQTGKHIIEMLELHNRRFEALRPQAGNWGSLRKPEHGRRTLLLRTGWTGSSNKDTRSAAFFGWLGVRVKERG